MKEDRRFSGIQSQASELIEQAFNCGFKAGLEEAKKRSKVEEEKFHIGDVVAWEGHGGYPIKCGIVTKLLTIDERAGIKVLLTDGTSYLMVISSIPSLKKVSSTNFPCIEECLNFLKNKEENENSK